MKRETASGLMRIATGIMIPVSIKGIIVIHATTGTIPVITTAATLTGFM